jgi:Pyruvate/2-oxoacid:ferredoxin oxidoreductase gamma subunit
MARRARGAGAVFQRADGRWEAQLRIGPSRRRSLYAQTRPDVVVKLDQALVDVSGIASQNASHPVEGLLSNS